MSKNLECPREVMHVYDNKGYTIDRYTISLMYDDGENFLVTSSINPTHPLGVWCASEGYIDYDEIEDNPEDNKHIGDEIDWDQLPDIVKATVNNYFEELTY